MTFTTIQVSSTAYLFVPGQGSVDLEFCQNCGTVRARTNGPALPCWVCKVPA
jgi:hypothetical protein